MRIVVTGGAGFIGSHITKTLLAVGHQVMVLDGIYLKDDRGEPIDLTPPGAEVYRRDIRDVSELPRCDALVHCAARADISKNWESRGQRNYLLSVNVEGTVNLLEAVAITPSCQRVVFLSTCGIYNDSVLGVETDKTPITSPYSASKLAGEAYVESYAYALGLKWHTLRLTCAVGSGYHHGHIADFVRMAKTEGIIRAKNDGHVVKSFVHVDDIAGAVRRMLWVPTDGTAEVPSGVYNVTSELWTWRRTLEVMGEMVGGSIPFEYKPQIHGWVGDPMAVVSGEKLDPWYRPHRSVKEGVREALVGLGWPS